MEVDEHIVKPAGFTIAEKATRFHSISQERAVTDGKSLEVVLRRFMDVVGDVSSQAGRLVIHHLEFDAGIILRELCRAGLQNLVPLWEQFASKGLCTMDPKIGKFIRLRLGMELAPHTNGNIMKLDNICKGLLPESKRLLSKRHTAACDAQLHVLVYRAIVKLAQPCL